MVDPAPGGGVFRVLDELERELEGGVRGRGSPETDRLPKFKISACEYDAPITFRVGSTAGVSLFLRELFAEFVRQKEVAVSFRSINAQRSPMSARFREIPYAEDG